MTENIDGELLPDQPLYIIDQQTQSTDLEDNKYGTYYRIVPLTTYRKNGGFVPDPAGIYKNKEIVFTLLGNPECNECGEKLEIMQKIYCKARKKHKVRENPAYCKDCKKTREKKKRTAQKL